MEWHNSSGRPLSSLSWLEAHHQAKLPERTAFAKSVLKLHPKRIVDLGCGPGIWLNLFDQMADLDCELIGVDSDLSAIKLCEQMASHWRRKSSFVLLDIEANVDKIPDADVLLAFNVFPYIKKPLHLMETLKGKLLGQGQLIIRQYDGALLRFGPMDQRLRTEMETSLWASTAVSEQFKHYDLDRIFGAIFESSFQNKKVEFEIFNRVSPYPHEFLTYFANTIEWNLAYVSDFTAKRLRHWYDSHVLHGFKTPSYFTETDLVGWVS